MEQFTASEVRDAITWKYGDKSTRISAMLNAFADMLEADEKAVPVAVVKDSDALYTGWLSWTGEPAPPETKLYTHPAPADADWKNHVLVGDMKALVDDAGNVLYVHKAIFDLQVHKTEDALATVSALTADAERLVEALVRISLIERNRSTSDTNRIDAVGRISREALAAHSAKAQPPAASVTDAMVNRMVAEYDAVLCGDPTATRTDGMRAALEAALTTQEGRNG